VTMNAVMMNADLHSYALLLLVGFLPTEIWRQFGVLVARRINDQSELFLWTRAVATAVLAGVIAKIVLYPPGTLANIPLLIRLGAIACGLGAVLLRQSILAGVLVGELVLVLGAALAMRG
jgi:Branched-chain amino acid transport protein (AzlD)